MDSFIKNYRKTKDLKSQNKGDIVKSFLENMKAIDVKRRQIFNLEKTKSLPKLNLRKIESEATPQPTGFMFSMAESQIDQEITNRDTNFKLNLVKIEEEEKNLPMTKIKTEVRGADFSSFLILPLQLNNIKSKIFNI